MIIYRDSRTVARVMLNKDMLAAFIETEDAETQAEARRALKEKWKAVVFFNNKVRIRRCSNAPYFEISCYRIDGFVLDAVLRKLERMEVDLIKRAEEASLERWAAMA